MYIIVGLGNPTQKYAKTRHNVGFMVIDRLAKENHITVNKRRHKGLCGQGQINGQQVLLVKPQTFMNLSGDCIGELVQFYKIDPPSELIIIYDDINLNPGEIRIRQKGSAGGHNGVKNIIAHLKTQEFPRVKIGIGEKPEGMELAEYVLQRFTKAENGLIQDAITRSVQALDEILANNIDGAMNKFNQRKS